MNKKFLLRVPDIIKIHGWSYAKENRYFNVAKHLDNDPYNLRPFEIPTWTLEEIMNINRPKYLNESNE